MKKSALVLSTFFVLSFLTTPTPFAQAGGCESTVDDVPDYAVRTTLDLNYRKTITGAEDENCPESEPLGAFANGQLLWVVGEVPTGVPVEEGSEEFLSWLYVEHPTTHEHVFIWGRYVEKVEAQEAGDHEEYEVQEDTKAFPDSGDNPDTTPETPNPEEPAPETLKDIIGHPYEEAVRYLEKKKVVSGFPDGTYRAEASINRAEFTKIVVIAKLGSEPTASAKDCFPDVLKEQWFATYICYAKDNDIISGHPDGNFRPGDPVQLSEAAKILVNTFGLEKDEPTDIWYQIYIEALQRNGYIPDTFDGFDQLVSRGQMAEAMMRIMEGLHDRPSKTFVFENRPVKSNLAMCIDQHLDSSIDMNQVRAEWLKWHNEARSSRNLEPLVLHEGLNYSSSLWAKSNEQTDTLTHDRANGQNAADWFTDIGITFKPVSGVTFGENLALGSYQCDKSNCTQDVIDAAKKHFDAFMAEEGTELTGHYDNIVQSDFHEVGLGLAVDENSNLLYLTTQYAQAVDGYPLSCN